MNKKLTSWADWEDISVDDIVSGIERGLGLYGLHDGGYAKTIWPTPFNNPPNKRKRGGYAPWKPSRINRLKTDLLHKGLGVLTQTQNRKKKDPDYKKALGGDIYIVRRNGARYHAKEI